MSAFLEIVRVCPELVVFCLITGGIVGFFWGAAYAKGI